MPNIKLTYFDLRARAEPCRLLLAYGGIKYEDDRIYNNIYSTQNKEQKISAKKALQNFHRKLDDYYIYTFKLLLQTFVFMLDIL